MNRKTVYRCFIIVCVLGCMLCADSTIGLEAQEKDYDAVTWQDVNQKREERDKGNFFSNMYYYVFKQRKETTYQGDEITVIQTAGNIAPDDNDSPIDFVHITSD